MSTELPVKGPLGAVHWLRGGSVSPRIEHCPGCIAEARKWPKEPAGFAAIDGTHTHTLIERSVINLNFDARRWIGGSMEDHEGSFAIDSARAERAQVMLDYVARRMRELTNASLHSEIFVDAGSQFGVPLWGGSVDVLITADEGIEVIDYKDGYKPISPQGAQNLTYLIGARAMLKGKKASMGRIWSTIVQPKFSPVPLTHEYTPEEFNQRTAKLLTAMQDSMLDDPPYRTGEHCRYCPGSKPGRCVAFNTQVSQTLRTTFQSTPKPMQDFQVAMPVEQQAPSLPEGISIPTVSEEISDEQLRQILDAAPLVREWLKEAEAEALRRMREGAIIPTYKIIRASTRRRWSLPEEEAAQKLRGMGLKKAEYLAEKLRSPTQVLKEEAVRKWSDRKRKNLDALIERPEGEMKVVPETEPGEALQVLTTDPFAAVPPIEDDVPSFM